jgi:hypothetical protein
MSEPLTRLLAELPPIDPDPARTERIRVRCRAVMARQAPRASASPAADPRGGALQLWQPLIVVLSVAYLTEVIVQAIRVYGVP